MHRAAPSPEAFEALVRERQGAVFGTLHRLTGPGPHLEDLAQEVFMRLFRALPEFRGDSQLSTYLYRITVNVAQDEWNRRRRDRAYLASPPGPGHDPDVNQDSSAWLENQPAPTSSHHTRSPEQHLSDAETAAAVERALLTLPDVERTVLVLYHSEELSYEGIAAALALPINTVRTHLHRGRKRLAAAVQQRPAPAHPNPQHGSSSTHTPTGLLDAAERRAG